MIDIYYALGILAMLLLLFLAVILTVNQVKDMARLEARQEKLEKSVRLELDALRERVREVDNAEKQNHREGETVNRS